MDGRMKVTHCSCCQAQESQSERNCEDSEVRLVWFINIQTVLDLIMSEAFDVNLALLFQ